MKIYLMKDSMFVYCFSNTQNSIPFWERCSRVECENCIVGKNNKKAINDKIVKIISSTGGVPLLLYGEIPCP